jgi:tellurite methyltransferase
VTLFPWTRGWEPIWADLDALPVYWRTPERSVVAWAEQLWEAGGRRVLDLGCGVGRHTVALARMGFAVTATDVSPSGLATCAAWLVREGLNATLVCHEMGALPASGCAFDGLIAYNVVYHTTVAGMKRVLAGIRRVLRPGGQLYVTVTARSDSKIANYHADMEIGKCQEIEPFTFIYLRDAPGDKHLPHHYCDEAELRSFLADFVVDDLCLMRVEYVDDDGVVQTGAHYHVQARRP